MNFLDNPEERDQVTIELTSLIDVMFMLVLFFLVTTSFSSAPGINVNLPKSSAKEILRDKKDITIVIGTNQLFAINQKSVTESQLVEQLYQAGQADPNTLVIVRADSQVNHGLVVKIMDYAKKAGLNRLAIATDPIE